MDKRIGTEISLQEALLMLIHKKCDYITTQGYIFRYKDGIVVDEYDKIVIMGGRYAGKCGDSPYFSLDGLLNLYVKWIPKLNETKEEIKMSRKILTIKEFLRAIMDEKRLTFDGSDYSPYQLIGDNFVDCEGDRRDIALDEDWYLYEESTEIEQLKAQVENQEKELAELKEKLKEAGK